MPLHHLISPDDRYRVRLLLHPGVQGSDYINACYVDVSPLYCTSHDSHVTHPTPYPPGLSATSSVHPDPGTNVQHSDRFLEDGVGTQVFLYHDVVSVGGKGGGMWLRGQICG